MNGQKPAVVTTFEEKPDVALLPDGRLAAVFLRIRGGQQEVAARMSTDGGHSWGDPEPWLALPKEPGGWAGPLVLVDADGSAHLFLLNDAHTGVIQVGEQRQKPLPMAELRLDVWHVRSTRALSSWGAPKRIWKGYTGALNGVIQLQSGRIVLPFSRFTNRHWAEHTGHLHDDYTFTGQYEVASVHSDDGGDTWHLSPSALRVPTPNLFAYGADEPVVLELKDGMVWMVIRTQLGWHYESFSEDGASWSAPRPSRFAASDSPAGLVRVPDGRIVLIWNNCLRFPYALGGRHVIHAAISGDEGATWHGFREVFRDPLRSQPVPQKGDFGTAYPFVAATPQGKILLTTGQGKGRVAAVLIDPDWLEERVAEDDFSAGVEQWEHFGTRGVELVSSPEGKGRKALRVRKTDDEWPAAAIWNFPLGKKGHLEVRLRLAQGTAAANLGLTDHFSVPFDQEDILHNVFNLPIDSNHGLPGGTIAQPDQWHILRLDWDLADRQCNVLLDGSGACMLPQLRQSPGICYLRLKGLSEETDKVGFLVGSVHCEVST